MIKRAAFKNFKALRDVEVTFDSRLTVLVGPNGSGKTSVLQGIQIVGKFYTGGEYYHLISNSAAEKIEKDKAERCDSLIVPKGVLGNAILEVDWVDYPEQEFGTTCRLVSQGALSRIREPNFGHLPSKARLLDQISLLRFDPDALKASSIPVTIEPTVSQEGANLASRLAFLHRKRPSVFAEIVTHLREIIPNIRSIAPDYEQAATGVADSIVFGFINANEVPAASVSDGTMVILGLITVIMSSDSGKILLLDDLDHRLHPKAQMALVDLLRKLLDQFPDLQIIATSHSPFILDRLEPNEVRVTGLRDDGSAVIARLEDAPEFDRWKESMTPGEFWSHMGDDWVKKIEPRTAVAAP